MAVRQSVAGGVGVSVIIDKQGLRLDAFAVAVRLVPLGTWVVRGKATTPLLAHEQGH